jgi:hypothetical protein
MVRPPSSMNPSIRGKFSFSNDKEEGQIYDWGGAVWLHIRTTYGGGGGLGLARRGKGISRIHFDFVTSSDLINFLI